MTKVLSLGLLVLGLAGFAAAKKDKDKDTAPEIDPGQATTALALLSGAAVVIRGRKK